MIELELGFVRIEFEFRLKNRIIEKTERPKDHVVKDITPPAPLH